MTIMRCTYTGDGQTTLEHLGNGAKIKTDLPLDNGGKGREFSPTDLFASSLAACSITIMAKMAATHGKSLNGATIEVEKVMASAPRRVSKLILKINFPQDTAQEDKPKYLAAIRACPVHNSISKDIELEITSN